MEKAGVIVGSILGATVVLLAFAFIVMFPAPSIEPPEICSDKWTWEEVQ